MIADSSRRFVEASLLRAEKALRSAKLLLEHMELEDAVSRAYYAMFHATKAILFSKGVKAKTHRGTISEWILPTNGNKKRNKKWNIQRRKSHRKAS